MESIVLENQMTYKIPRYNHNVECCPAHSLQNMELWPLSSTGILHIYPVEWKLESGPVKELELGQGQRPGPGLGRGPRPGPGLGPSQILGLRLGQRQGLVQVLWIRTRP